MMRPNASRRPALALAPARRRRLVDEAHDALHEPPAGGAQQAVEVEAVVLSLRLH